MTDELAELRERRRRAAERRREIGGDYFEALYDVVGHSVPWEGRLFKIAATQEGLVDFATPESGTYPLTLASVDAMIAALAAVATEIRQRDVKSQESPH
jgi:hypothetical protein